MARDVKQEPDLWAAWPSQTRRRVLAAALDSFAERGFHGTNLKHIAHGWIGESSSAAAHRSPYSAPGGHRRTASPAADRRRCVAPTGIGNR